MVDDIYSLYEVGINQLIAKLKNDEFDELGNALVYQQRLLENISFSRRYGNTERTTSERTQVIDALNDLSLSTLQITFNELCSSSQKTKLKKIKHNLPNPYHNVFFGREKEIDQLRQLLLPYPLSRYHIISIEGIGGVGKTSLALELTSSILANSHNYTPDEQFDVIVWVSAKKSWLTPDGIRERHQMFKTLDDIFAAIAITTDNLLAWQNKSCKEQITIIRKILSEKRCLLVIDNWESSEEPNLIEDFLRELPSPSKCIITTRIHLDIAFPIRLKGLSKQDAAKLIENESFHKNVMISNENSEYLYKLTGGVPLAIVWSISRMSIGYGLDILTESINNASSDIALYCFEKLINAIVNTNSYSLLLALAVFPGGASQEGVGIVAGLENDDFSRDNGLAVLERLDLIERVKNTVGIQSRFVMLTLTRRYALARLLHNQTLFKTYETRWINYMQEIAVQCSSDIQVWTNRDMAFEEIDNLISATESTFANKQYVQYLAVIRPVLLYWDATGFWEYLLQYGEQAIAIAHNVGDNVSIVWLATNSLGWVYVATKRYGKAEEILNESLAISIKSNNLRGQASVLWLLGREKRKRGLFH